jgi:hypothetical protein
LGVPIKNDIGDFNCYINVLIHTIYHTKELRRFLTDIEIKNNSRNILLSELKVKITNLDINRQL